MSCWGRCSDNMGIMSRKCMVCFVRRDEKKGKTELPKDGCFVVEIVKASNVPRSDVYSESDPLVKAFISQKNWRGRWRRVTSMHTTLVKVDNENPTWHSYACLPCKPPHDTVFTVRIYDSDFERSHVLRSDSLLGIARIPIERLSRDEKEFDFPFENLIGKNNPDFTVTVRRAFLTSQPPARKTFFIVRHGESKWNKAQREKDVAAMLGSVDHSLTETGCNQALKLSEWLTSVSKKLTPDPSCPLIDDADLTSTGFNQERVNDKYLALLYNAEAFYSSPLTRAVQTALIGLKDHQHLRDKGLTLYSVIREVKNMFGRDTIGDKTGDNIAPHVRAELAATMGDPAAAARLTDLPIRPFDCDKPWWTAGQDYDSDEYQKHRIREFLAFARCEPARAAVYVGHSLFWKAAAALLTDPSADELKQRRPDLFERLRRLKLGNAAMAAVTVTFPPDGGAPRLEDAELLYGSFHGQEEDKYDDVSDPEILKALKKAAADSEAAAEAEKKAAAAAGGPDRKPPPAAKGHV